MAADEDIVRFAAEIHKNSNRLLTLINDIIRLSELDQVEEQNCFEELDIYDIAQNCVEMLRLSAKKHDVTMELHGVHRIICANRQMMDELVYNLCDNAIRYNNPGGRVDITVMQPLRLIKRQKPEQRLLRSRIPVSAFQKNIRSVYLSAFTAWIKAVLNQREEQDWGLLL